MAASLRAAATRTLRPAVLPGEGLHRLVHTQQQHFLQGSSASLIQQKKEELYDAIAEAEAKSVASDQDTYLLKALCTHVEPRPYDPQWRRITKTRKLINLTVASVAFVASGLTFCGVVARPKEGYHEHVVAAENVREPVVRYSVPEPVVPYSVPEPVVPEPVDQKWLADSVPEPVDPRWLPQSMVKQMVQGKLPPSVVEPVVPHGVPEPTIQVRVFDSVPEPVDSEEAVSKDA